MNRRIFTSLAAAAVVAASILISSGAAEAAPDATTATTDALGGAPTPNNKLDPTIQVQPEADYKIVATLRGIGKQVYDCNGSTYVFREPIAGLFTTRGIPAGIHGAPDVPTSPFWANFDGSRFVGNTVPGTPGFAAVLAPNATKDIKWLRVPKAKTAGSGAFGSAEFVQRTDTHGGQPPASCTGSSTVSVDYSTFYVFWAHK